MSEDTYTEVTNQGCLSRFMESIKGVLVGIVIFLVAFPVLFWNEGRAVQTRKSLDEGAAAVVSLQAAEVSPDNDSALVHLQGKIASEEVLTDSVFGITSDAIKLQRSVEMYQWKEKKKTEKKTNAGGSETKKVTYSYAKGWSNKLISSSSFNKPAGHENPGAMPFSQETYTVKSATVGDFSLSESLIEQMNNWDTLTVTAEHQAALSEDLGATLRLHDNSFYKGMDPSNPTVGDARIAFKHAPVADVSIIAQQLGTALAAYQTQAGDKLQILEVGIKSSEEMFQAAHSANKMMTWLLRLGGFLGMFMGLNLIFKPFTILADVIPVVGSIFRAGAGIIAGLFSFPLALVTIAVAWIFYRPLVGIILLVIAAIFFVGMLGLAIVIATLVSKKQKAEAAKEAELAAT